jgi:hypothetical protein
MPKNWDPYWRSVTEQHDKTRSRCRFKLYEWGEIVNMPKEEWTRRCIAEGDDMSPHGDDLDESEMAELARLEAVRKRRVGL